MLYVIIIKEFFFIHLDILDAVNTMFWPTYSSAPVRYKNPRGIKWKENSFFYKGEKKTWHGKS